MEALSLPNGIFQAVRAIIVDDSLIRETAAHVDGVLLGQQSIDRKAEQQRKNEHAGVSEPHSESRTTRRAKSIETYQHGNRCPSMDVNWSSVKGIGRRGLQQYWFVPKKAIELSSQDREESDVSEFKEPPETAPEIR